MQLHKYFSSIVWWCIDPKNAKLPGKLMAQSMSAKYVLPNVYCNWLLAIFQQIYQASDLGPDEGKIDCCKNITKTLPFEKCQNNGQLTNDGWANGQ